MVTFWNVPSYKSHNTTLSISILYIISKIVSNKVITNFETSDMKEVSSSS